VNAPLVGLIMGSDSDWPVMSGAAEALAEFDVRHEVGVVSAHRTPQRMLAYAEEAGSSSRVRGAPPTCPEWWPRPLSCR
jgi:5-(carboxyamino)imidazole ribonucleotide mutase